MKRVSFHSALLRATAETKLTADGQLTEEAIKEANAHSFDHAAYKKLLGHLKNSQSDRMGKLIEDA
jgi:hypothetical protein